MHLNRSELPASALVSCIRYCADQQPQYTNHWHDATWAMLPPA